LQRLRQQEEDLNTQLEIQESEERIRQAQLRLAGERSLTLDSDQRSNQSHDDSSRSSTVRLAIPELYYGKSLKEHTNFMWSVMSISGGIRTSSAMM
jgi:hypothetical protein